jgi:nicotinamidase-related amidase
MRHDPEGGPLLVVIDMQRLFEDPASPWAIRGFDRIVKPVDQLVSAFGDRAVFTRFVVPDRWEGSWEPYYRQWRPVTQPEARPLAELSEPWASRRPWTLDRPTFSTWGAELRDAAGPSSTLVICGVATDCCVIATALPAVDDGVFVRVVADACAGATEKAHEAALTVMGGFAPQIEITTVREELERAAAGATG